MLHNLGELDYPCNRPHWKFCWTCYGLPNPADCQQRVATARAASSVWLWFALRSTVPSSAGMSAEHRYRICRTSVVNACETGACRCQVRWNPDTAVAAV